MAQFENNGLTIGERYNSIQNLIPRSIQHFVIWTTKMRTDCRCEVDLIDQF